MILRGADKLPSLRSPAIGHAARVSLEAPAPDPVVVESVEAFMLRVGGHRVAELSMLP